MYKKDLALNKLQVLICHKIQINKPSSALEFLIPTSRSQQLSIFFDYYVSLDLFSSDFGWYIILKKKNKDEIAGPFNK